MSESRSKPSSDAPSQYAAAYATHYTAKDLRAAVSLYGAIASGFPDSPEAVYAKAQIQNIVNTVVPKPAFYEAQVALALAHIAV